MSRIVFDKFDSKVTGKRCGLLDARSPVPDLAEIRAWCEDFDHVRCVIGLDGTLGWHYRAGHFQDAGFYLASVRSTFESAGRWPVMLGGSLRAPAEGDETSYLCSGTVAHMFDKSRFYTDPFYGGQAACSAQQLWITNMIKDHRLLVLEDSSVLGERGFGKGLGGFVGFDRDATEDGQAVLEISLIASFAPKRGIGRQMVTDLARQIPHDVLRATTQIYNEPAIGLYRGLGMKQVKTEAIFAWRRR